MSACWKSLAQDSNIDLKILAMGERPNDSSEPEFSTNIVEGLNVQLFNADEINDSTAIRRTLIREKPDVIVLSGWFIPAYLQAIRSPELTSAKLVLCSDNPFQATWRQRLGKFKIRWLLNRAALCVVPGERGFQLMRHWGVPAAKIRKGLYGVDTEIYANCLTERSASQAGWPKSFLFVGRYIPRKGVDIMLRAFAAYRDRFDDPWDLVCCGRGELGPDVSAAAGVIDAGFTQPSDLVARIRDAGVFVMPSIHDAWPLAIVEAANAGLPIICTSICGSSVELVCDFFNGLTVPPRDEAALTAAFSWMHQNHNLLPQFGERSSRLGSAYTAEAWRNKWSEMFKSLGP